LERKQTLSHFAVILQLNENFTITKQSRQKSWAAAHFHIRLWLSLLRPMTQEEPGFPPVEKIEEFLADLGKSKYPGIVHQ
jgi:hypothetical protein